MPQAARGVYWGIWLTMMGKMGMGFSLSAS